MDRTVSQAQRPGAEGRRFAQGRLRRLRKARRGHVDRLLEERPLERIGLVEEGQGSQLAAREEPLEGDLGAVHVVLDEDFIGRGPALEDIGRRQDRLDAAPCGSEPLGVVGADHSPAPGEKRRLEDAGVRDSGRRAIRSAAERENMVGRRRRAAPREELPHPFLVPRRRDRFQGVVRQPQRFRDRGRRDDRVLVDADGRRDRGGLRELGDAPRAARRVAEVQREQTLRIERFHGARLLRGDRHRDAELLGGPQEVARPVARGREQEQDACHGPMLAPSDARRVTIRE